MKNNKGFVVSAVLYPLLVLFLALIMGLISMSSTRKSILNNMKLDISDSLFDDATCSCETISNKLDVIIKGGGISGGGNGDVVALSLKNYPTRNEFPSKGNARNDIAIVSTMEVNGYFLTDKQPTYPAEGSVWVYLKQSSPTSIATGEVSIPVAYAQQYQSGAWKKVEAAIYDGKEWVALNYTATENATAGNILTGKTALVNGSLVTGTMANRGAVTQTLNAGGSYTIPAGYHNGSGKVTANSLASQTSGTATSGDILKGKTAWVNGQKVTGSKVDSAMYFKIVDGEQNIGENAVYLHGRKVDVYYGACGTYETAICVDWVNDAGTTETIAIAGETDTKVAWIENVHQVSKNVILVHYYTETEKESTSSTGSKTTTTYMHQLISYYISSTGKLTKSDAQTITENHVVGETTYYFTSDRSDYYYDSSKSYTDRTVEFDLIEQPFTDNFNKTYKYLTFYQKMNQIYEHDTNYDTNYEMDGICMSAITINRYTGALSKSTRKCNTVKYYDDKDTPNYSSAYEFEKSSFGYIQKTYTANDHSIEKSFLVNSFVGSSLVSNTALTTSNISSSPLYAINNYSYGYNGDVLYAMDAGFSFSRSGNIDKINTSIESAPAESNGIFANTSSYNSKSQSFDISGIVPAGLTYRGISKYYSDLSQKFYVIMDFSTGKLYMTFSVSHHTAAKDGMLSLSLDSATYRASENGTKISTEQFSYFDNKIVEYYR